MALEITIDQNEIETAIKRHIGTLFTVNDGQSISISMKAGRGDNGFSATIEIGGTGKPAPQTETAAAPAEADKPKPTVTGPFKRNAKPAAEPAPETAPAAQETAPTAEPDSVATAGDDAGLDEAQPVQQADQEAPAADKPKSGLFAHLGNRTGTTSAE